MHLYLRKACSAFLLATAPLTPAMAGEARELFTPMPMAALQSAQDPTLRAIYDVPAYHMINRVTADAGALREDTQEIRLSLAPQLYGAVRRTHAETLPDGTTVWRGQWDDGRSAIKGVNTEPSWLEAANEVTLVNHGGRITGSVRANGQLYSIRPLASGGHAIIAVTEAKLPARLPPLKRTATMPTAANRAMPRQAATDDINPRVMIVFSNEAAKSLEDPLGYAHLVLAETNDGFARSGVNHRLSLAKHVLATDYKESGSLPTDLDRLAAPGDGIIDWIHGARDETKADLVTLLTVNGIVVPEYCGATHANVKDAKDGFFAVAIACAAGSYAYATTLGRLYGASDFYLEPGDDDLAHYPYGHGFWNQETGLGTLMASFFCEDECTRVNIWSGPNSRWNGNVMGNEHEANNARVLNERAGTIANFR
jgi:peptidyl-Asp metalloendopeptidase